MNSTQSQPETHQLDEWTRFAALATGAVVFWFWSAAMALLVQCVPNNEAKIIWDLWTAGGITYALYLAHEASKIYKNRT